jgi:hypothetical protein
MYTESQIKQLVNDYLRAVLNRVESLRSIAMVRYECEGQQQITTNSDADVIINTSIKAIDELIESNKIKLLKNDFSEVSTRVDRYMKEKNLTIEIGTVKYNTFCREILKAEIEALKVEKERMKGNYDCQSALKNDPPSAAKIDPPQVVVFSC